MTLQTAVAPKAAVNPADLLTYVAFILDGSGSMASVQKEAREAYNQQVREVRKKSVGMNTKVSCVTFSTYVNPPVVWNKPVEELVEIDEKDYNPDGYTALYDAIGGTVTKLKQLEKADDENTSFLVVIVSDGEENASQYFNQFEIKSMIESLQATKRWTFVFLGANQDLNATQRSTGIYPGNMAVFDSSHDGVKMAASMNSMHSGDYMDSRRLGVSASINFYGKDSFKNQKGDPFQMPKVDPLKSTREDKRKEFLDKTFKNT